MPRKKASVESALQHKGFQKTEGDHHYFVYVRKDGKKTLAKTKTSHSKKMKDIPDVLLSQMARQCFLTKPDFLDLVDCPMTRDIFEEKLAAAGGNPQESNPKPDTNTKRTEQKAQKRRT